MSRGIDAAKTYLCMLLKSIVSWNLNVACGVVILGRRRREGKEPNHRKLTNQSPSLWEIIIAYLSWFNGNPKQINL